MAHKREHFTSREIASVLSHYDLGEISMIREFTRGAPAAAKLLISSDRGRFLLKRRAKGKDDPQRVAFAHELQKFLASKSFPLPHLVDLCAGGGSLLQIGDAIYEVFEFIDGEHYRGGLAATYDSGKTLALCHKLLGDFRSESRRPQGRYHDSQMVRDSVEALPEKLRESRSVLGHERALADLLAQLEHAYDVAAQAVNNLGMPQWPPQFVHADWHPGNMLFAGDRVVAVLDYDSARVWPRILDVANGCLQFSAVTGGRNLSKWEDRTDDVRAREFLRGYDQVAVISRAELQAVPFLMQEALIAQTFPPILQTGTFAGLDGFGFLQVTLRKVRWLKNRRELLMLDTDEPR
ncbi:MAG TPA: phosphotransferase [Phycisphaerae bacterium]|nr:phosphotransferase [Phycisphaerae bacterium]